MLEQEIIKRILADVGAVPGPDFGKAGITMLDFKVDKELSVNFEDGGHRNFPLWAGQGMFATSKINALLVDLTDEVTEYALAIRVDNKPIYALRIAYDDEDAGIFMLQEGENWIFPNMLVKIWALLGMEMIVDQGMLWHPSTVHDDLYQAISHLIEV